MILRFYPAESYPPFEINPSTSVRKVMEEINRLGLRCVPLVNEAGLFLGLVTDGDLRRLIIGGLDLDLPCSVLLEKETLTVEKSATLDKVEEIMNARSVDQLPVLDRQKNYLGLYLFDSPELGPLNVSATGFIMAGGKGSRLRPLTLSTPKPLIKVGRSTLIDSTLQAMAKSGVRRIFVSVNYLADQVVAGLEGGSKLGLEIEFLSEDFETGTAGSLSKLAGMDVESSIIVSNADILHKADLRDVLNFHQDNDSDLTILTMPYQVSVPFGVVETNDCEFERIVEKPTYSFSVSAGVYVVSRDLIGDIPSDRKYDMPELIADAKKDSRKVLAFKGSGPWMDVGTVGSLERARETWLDV